MNRFSIIIKLVGDKYEKYEDCVEAGDTIDSEQWTYEQNKVGVIMRNNKFKVIYPWHNILRVDITRYEDE